MCESWYDENNHDKTYHEYEMKISKETFDKRGLGELGEKMPKEMNCSRCGQKYNGEELNYHMRGETKWNTPNEKDDKPGYMFESEWIHNNGKCMYWDNCESPHLQIVLPNGGIWDSDSRASNCTKKEDKIHRCWIKHGDITNLTIDKNGNTCAAGAGSIMSGKFHGFIRNGRIVD